jgi:hypothetical protein
MRLLKIAAAIAVIWTLPAAGLAQTSAAAADAAPAPSAHSIELAKRFFVVTHVDALMDTLMANLLPSVIQSETKRLPNASPEFVAAVTEASLSATREWAPKYMDRVAVEYARVFTDQELEGAIAFYESPTGKSLIAKMPKLAPVATRIALAMQPELIQMIQERTCKKIDCSALDKSAPTTAR